MGHNSNVVQSIAPTPVCVAQTRKVLGVRPTKAANYVPASDTFMGNANVIVKVEWSNELVESFLDICIDLALEGRKPRTHLDAKEYQLLESKMRDKHSVFLNRVQLKNKFERILKEWQLWKTLFKQIGKGWSNERQMWDGWDDTWWQNFKIARHLHALFIYFNYCL